MSNLGRNLRMEITNKFDINVDVIINSDGTYTLTWNDGVANEWNETFSTLSVTLHRLASLIRCGERDWETGFTFTPEGHEKRALEIFDDLFV